MSDYWICDIHNTEGYGNFLCHDCDPEAWREHHFPSEYYRLQGNMYVKRNIVYICPLCASTRKQPVISCYQINTICSCNLPYSVTQMIKVGVF
jgi:hypothetical protein